MSDNRLTHIELKLEITYDGLICKSTFQRYDMMQNELNEVFMQFLKQYKAKKLPRDYRWYLQEGKEKKFCSRTQPIYKYKKRLLGIFEK